MTVVLDNNLICTICVARIYNCLPPSVSVSVAVAVTRLLAAYLSRRAVVMESESVPRDLYSCIFNLYLKVGGQANCC